MPNFTKVNGKVLDINRKIFANKCVLYALKDDPVRGYLPIVIGSDVSGLVPKNWNATDLGTQLLVEVAALKDVTRTVLASITMFGFKRSDETDIRVFKVDSIKIARLVSNDVWSFNCSITGEAYYNDAELGMEIPVEL